MTFSMMFNHIGRSEFQILSLKAFQTSKKGSNNFIISLASL